MWVVLLNVALHGNPVPLLPHGCADCGCALRDAISDGGRRSHGGGPSWRWTPLGVRVIPWSSVGGARVWTEEASTPGPPARSRCPCGLPFPYESIRVPPFADGVTLTVDCGRGRTGYLAIPGPLLVEGRRALSSICGHVGVEFPSPYAPPLVLWLAHSQGLRRRSLIVALAGWAGGVLMFVWSLGLL